MSEDYGEMAKMLLTPGQTDAITGPTACSRSRTGAHRFCNPAPGPGLKLTMLTPIHPLDHSDLTALA